MRKLMTTFQKIINSVLVLGVLILGGLHFIPSKTLGDATVSNYPTWYYNGIQIGPTGTSPIANIIEGTCNLTGAASTASGATNSTTCAVTGTNVGDKVFVLGPTVGSNGGFSYVAASIVTAGTITVVLQNTSGTTATPNGGTITGVQYLIFR